MKDILKGGAAAALGFIIAWGPQFIFKACSTEDCGCCGAYPQCFWATQAILGLGMMIAALGLCMIIFPDPKTQFGLLIAIFITAVFAILVPYVIIGACPGFMACKRRAYPGIATFAGITILYSVFLGFLIKRKEKKSLGV